MQDPAPGSGCDHVANPVLRLRIFAYAADDPREKQVFDQGMKTGNEKRNLNIGTGLRLAFLVLGTQVLVTALAAARCADRVACVTVHAYFHVE
jgi:hypothetical protein